MITVKESDFLTLDEDVVQIQFKKDAYYNTGDYWLILACTATGDVIWPIDEDSKEEICLPPHGIEHHYASLAIVVPFCESECGSEAGIKVIDCQCTFKSLCDNNWIKICTINPNESYYLSVMGITSSVKTQMLNIYFDNYHQPILF